MGLFLGIWLATVIAPYPVVVPSPERLRELMAKLEVPCRHMSDQKRGPYDGDGPAPSRNFRAHSEAMWELARAGPTATPLLLALYADTMKPVQARIHAIRALCWQLCGYLNTPDPKVIAAIRSAIQDKDPAIREAILSHLVLCGANANHNVPGAPSPLRFALAPASLRAISPAVLVATADEDAEIAETALRAIWTFGQSNVGLPELFAALKRPEPKVRSQALSTLGEVGRSDPATLPIILDALKRPDEPRTYRCAVGLVGYFGTKATVAIPALIEALEEKSGEVYDDRNTVRSLAARSLGRMGADAKPAVPAILGYFQATGPNRPSYGERLELVEILESIDPSSAVTARAIEKKAQDDFRREVESKSRIRDPQ